MRLDYILKASAKRMHGVFVDVDSSRSTVCISSKNEDDIFMQGEDADKFIEECEQYSKRCKCLDFCIIELAVAETYVECIWS